MYDHYFSNFGRPPFSDDICKDSATRRPWFWRRRFLKVFPIEMHRDGWMDGYFVYRRSTLKGHIASNKFYVI